MRDTSGGAMSTGNSVKSFGKKRVVKQEGVQAEVKPEPAPVFVDKGDQPVPPDEDFGPAKSVETKPVVKHDTKPATSGKKEK